MISPPFSWLLRHFAGGYARAQPGRAIIQVAAIATGVALGYAVNLINSSALDAYSAAERSLSGRSDVSVTGPPAGFDESWFARIAADPSVAIASPLLEVDATVAAKSTQAASGGKPLALRILGIDALRSALLEPELVGTPSRRRPDDSGLAELLSEGLYVSPAALAQLQLAPGDEISLVVGAHRVRLPIAGELAGAHGAIATMDLGFAQWRLERLGQLSRIDIKFVPGADAAAAERSWHLPPQLQLESRESAIDRQQGLSRAYRVNLDVLSMVALFTGAFLVFSLQSQSIVARRAPLALLRMLGLSRAQLSWLLVFEALAFGSIGALLGLAIGAALALAALRVLGGDLGGGYFAGIQPAIAIDPAGAVLFFTLGLAASVGGAWLPAREAGRQPPASALKAGADPGPGSQRPRGWTALAGFVLALALLAAPAVDGIALGAYAAIALLLVATIALKPLLAPRLFGPLGKWVSGNARLARMAPAWLAATRLARVPRFAAVGAAGIVASFALMVAMATMVGSFRSSFDSWLAHMLPADLYVRAAAAGSTGRFSARDLQLLQSDPDIARARFSRIQYLRLDPARAPVALIARSVDRMHPETALAVTGRQIGIDSPAIPVWISEAMVDLYGAQAGAPLDLPIGGRSVRVIVAGLWRDYVRQGGSVVIDVADYERLSGDATRTDAALWLRNGAQPGAVSQRLLQALEAPAAQIVEPGQVREISLRLFDRSFRVTYVLEWAAIAIGLAGLATTFSAQAIARTREFGMLRHLGVTRGQVLVLLAAEAALVTALALGLGLGAGLAIAWILVKFVNPQSFHWSMDLRIPGQMLLLLGVTLLAGAIAASALAGRRALSVDVLRAVKDDW